MESDSNGSQSSQEQSATSYISTFIHDAKFHIGVQPGKNEKTPTGRILTSYGLDNLATHQSAGVISGYVSVEDGKNVFDTELIANHTVFVDRPPYLHVPDRTRTNPNYIPHLVPAAIKHMLQAGIFDIWYSSNIDGISEEAQYMYQQSLIDLGLIVEPIKRDVMDYKGDISNVTVYKVTQPLV